MNEKLKIAAGVAAGALISAAVAVPLADDSKIVDAQLSKISQIKEDLDVTKTKIVELEATIDSTVETNTALEADLAEAISEAKAAKDELQSKDDAEEQARVTDETTVLVDSVNLDGNFAEEITSRDLPKLLDGEIRYDGESYDVEETIKLSSNVEVLTTADDSDLKDKLAVGLTDSNSINYEYEFKDPVKLVDDEPLEISFLGESLLISEIDGASSEITIQKGKDVTLDVGDSISVGDVLVALDSVGDDEVALNIGGKVVIFEEGQTKNVNDVEVYVKNVFDSSIGNSFAQVIVGEDVKETIEDGDEYEADDRYEWIVNINGDNELVKLGVTFVDVEDDVDDKLLYVGDSIKLPNDYAEVSFEGMSEDYEYNTLTFDVNADEVVIEASEDESVLINGDEVDDNKFTFDGTKVVYDVDGDELEATIADVLIEVNDREITLTGDATEITLSNGVQVFLDFANKEISDVTLDAQSILSKEDYRTVFGDVIKGDIEDDAEDGKFEIDLIEEEAEVDMRVR